MLHLEYLGGCLPSGEAGTALLRFIHARPSRVNIQEDYDLDDLRKLCQAESGSLFVTTDIHSNEALSYVRQLQPTSELFMGREFLDPNFSTYHGMAQLMFTSGKFLTTGRWTYRIVGTPSRRKGDWRHYSPCCVNT